MNKRKHLRAVTPDPRPRRSRVWLEFLAMLLMAVAVSGCLHFVTESVSDSDSLYHTRHAWVYHTYGLWYGDFPWVTASVIGKYGGDLWYGFHVLLVPFSYLNDPLLAVRLGGAMLTVGALLLLWWALKLYRVPAAWLWPWLMLLSAPATAGRTGSTRPHVLSNALELLVLPVLARGVVWEIGLLGLAFSFLHFNVCWILLLVALTYVGVSLAVTRRLAWRQFLALLAGMAVGWLLRPHAWNTARLFVDQNWVKLMASAQGVAFSSSSDTTPLSPVVVQANYLPGLLLWLFGSLLFLVVARRRWHVEEGARLALWTCGLLSLLFFLMALGVAGRATDQWQIFGFAFLALASGVAGERPEVRAWLRQRRKLAVAGGFLAVVGAALLVAHGVTWGLATTKYMMPKATRLRPACTYLKLFSPRGSIVYNPHWDTFGELFFWDTHNRYRNGMDPIFEYAYSPSLYWKTTHLLSGAGLLTWGGPERDPARAEEAYTVLRRDFHASYLLLHRRQDAALSRHVLRDPRFRLCYDDEQWLLFDLRDPPGRKQP